MLRRPARASSKTAPRPTRHAVRALRVALHRQLAGALATWKEACLNDDHESNHRAHVLARAVRAIRAQDSYRESPWQMGVLAKLLRLAKLLKLFRVSKLFLYAREFGTWLEDEEE